MVEDRLAVFQLFLQRTVGRRAGIFPRTATFLHLSIHIGHRKPGSWTFPHAGTKQPAHSVIVSEKPRHSPVVSAANRFAPRHPTRSRSSSSPSFGNARPAARSPALRAHLAATPLPIGKNSARRTCCFAPFPSIFPRSSRMFLLYFLITSPFRILCAG